MREVSLGENRYRCDMTIRDKSAQRKGCLLILIQAVLYGASDPLSKQAFERIPVFSMLMIRYLIASVIFVVPFRGKIKKELGLQARVKGGLWRVFLPGILLSVCFTIGTAALDYSDATSVAFLRSLSMLFVPLLSFLVLKEQIQMRIIPVQILALFGLYLICGAGDLKIGLGEVLSLIAACMMASALVWSRRCAAEVSAVTLSFVQCVVSFLLSMVLNLVFEGGVHLERATVGDWGILIFLAVSCSVFGFVLQNAALSMIDAETVALIQCLVPVMTALFARILLGERMTSRGILGASLITLGAVLTAMPGERRGKKRSGSAASAQTKSKGSAKE